MTPVIRTFVFVGVLGGFTTFSSFGLDTFTLGHGGDHVAAFWNVVGQVGLGLGGVWLGFYLGVSTGGTFGLEPHGAPFSIEIA